MARTAKRQRAVERWEGLMEQELIVQPKHFIRYTSMRQIIGTAKDAGKEVEGESEEEDERRKKARTAASSTPTPSSSTPSFPAGHATYRDPLASVIPPSFPTDYGGGMGEAFHDNDNPSPQKDASPKQVYREPPSKASSALPRPSSPWFPWPSREWLLVDTLVHSASGKISLSQPDDILRSMKEIIPHAISSLY
ncbi:hypothetical protein JCM10213_007511 [Rhodosporidiobolus nylandii]